MRLMEGEHVGPFNLGNPGEFTMLELAKVLFHYSTLMEVLGFICIHSIYLGAFHAWAGCPGDN